MLMIGSNSYMGSFEFDLGSDKRQPFLQHLFQEEFLHSFYEDEEFRNQVLRCLLSKTEVDSTIPMKFEGRPRRTWSKDLECPRLLLTRDDDEGGDSYCSGETCMFASVGESRRDAFSQCPEPGCLDMGCFGGALWNSDWQDAVVDAICQFPEPAELGCPTIWNVLTETPVRELHLGERYFCSSSGEEKGILSPQKLKENQFCRLGTNSPELPRAETDRVSSVAAWLQTACFEPRRMSRKFDFPCIPGAPGLLFSSNPRASLDWEDTPLELTQLKSKEDSPKTDPIPGTTAMVKEDEETPTPPSAQDQTRKDESQSSEGRPACTCTASSCLWDSFLKRLCKMKVRIMFRPARLGRIPGEGSSNPTSGEEPDVTLPRPGGKTYAI